MRPSARSLRPLAALAVLLLPACIPYAVGTTAHPTPQGRRDVTAMAYMTPDVDPMRPTSEGGVRTDDGTHGLAMDAEVRWGIGTRTDVGVRIPAMSGAVVTAKRRIVGADSGGAAVAVMAGGGMLNFGDHGLLELTLLASGPDGGRVTPYGGVRAMHVAAFGEEGTGAGTRAGLFAGLRVGSAGGGISPEVAVFRDAAPPGGTRGSVVVVPSISLHGAMLAHLVRAALPGRRGAAQGRGA